MNESSQLLLLSEVTSFMLTHWVSEKWSFLKHPYVRHLFPVLHGLAVVVGSTLGDLKYLR